MENEWPRSAHFPVWADQRFKILADGLQVWRECRVFAWGQGMQMFDDLINPRVGPHGTGADEFHAERNRALQRLFQFGHDFQGPIVGIQEQLELVVT